MKKILSLFLSVLMLTSVVAAVDLSAIADNSSETATEITVEAEKKATSKTAAEPLDEDAKMYVYGENPVYYDDGGVMYSEAESAKYNASSSYGSVEDAIVQVRNYLENRTTSFSVSYHVAEASSDMDWNYIFNGANDETGVSTQGDYIRWHWDSYSTAISYSSTGDGSEYNVTAKCTVAYFTTAAQEKTVTTAINNVVKGFGFTSSTSEYDKILAIYDYICNNVTYDYHNLNNRSYTLKYSAYAALINGTAVCQGYSLLMYRLMHECGIGCRVIVGADHAWNIVKLGTHYYNVDATWDSANSPYQYFLKCNASFNKDHTRQSDYNNSIFNEAYPMATSDHTQYTDDMVEPQHDFSIVKVLTNPTCEHHGYREIECSHAGCDERYTEQIAPTGHSWGSGKVTKAATCAATGVRTYTCSACAATHTESIAKTAHTYKTTTKKATISGNKATSGYTRKQCTVCGNIASNTTINPPTKLSLSATSYTYNGKTRKPTVTVKDSKGNKIAAKYYTISYIDQSTNKTVSSMKKPGKYYVKVTFKTNYSGSLKKAVTIKPKKTSFKSVTAASKGFTAKWSKDSSGVTGYQVQYSTNKNFKSAKTKTVSKASATSQKITKLKAKKKYYVRVRTYKTVKINGKSTKIYSAWSSSKAVTTKK